MNKNLLYILVLISIYGIVFAFAMSNTKIEEETIAPFALEALCLNDDISVALSSEGESICFDQKKNIYTIKNGEEYQLYVLLEEEDLLSAGPDFLLTQLAENIIITTFKEGRNIVTSTNIPLLEDESYLSRFYQSKSVYISTILIADSTDSIKSRIIRVDFDKLSNIKMEDYKSKHMYKVKSVSTDENPQLTLINPYAFLEPYQYVLDWKNRTETVQEINTESDENKYALNAKDSIYINKDHSLMYIKEENKPLLLLKYFAAEQLPSHMGTHYSKLDKTVYNCNDFGESEQITLRVCIPET